MSAINTWPGWECVREIGNGSFGKVYEIQREDRGKTYKAALKVITIPFSQSEIREAYSEGMNEQNVTEYFQEIVENITEEFALMSEFKGQSNIVSYEDHKVIKHEDGIGWDIIIRMEMLTSLSEWSGEHSLNEADVIAMGRDICHALELCWQKRIIHRDIKPENIFVNEYGDYKLGDFGIARTTEKTRANLSQKGTYMYMAPEVYRGQEYGRTADIYSLGIVLYRYLNENRMPFVPVEGTIRYNDREVAFKRRICGEQIPPPANGSQALKEAILKAVSYAPEERYQSASEFRQALERCVKEIEDDSERAGHLFRKKNTEGEELKLQEEMKLQEGLKPQEGPKLQERLKPQEELKAQEKLKPQGGKKNKMLIISVAGIVGFVLLVCVMLAIIKGMEDVISSKTRDTARKKTETDSVKDKADKEDETLDAEIVSNDSRQADKKYKIKIFKASDMSQLYEGEFVDSVYLGRSNENDIMLDDNSVSRRHCRITNKNGRFFIEDLKSTNGTLVNGKKIDGEMEIFPDATTSIGMGGEELIVLFETVKTALETAGKDDASNTDSDMQLYQLDDIGLAVKIPSEYKVVTRAMDTEPDWMIADGMTLEDVSEAFQGNDLYFMAWDKDHDWEIGINYTPENNLNIGSLNESEMEELSGWVVKGYGGTLIDSDVYQSEWAKYMKIYFSKEIGGYKVYILQYCTSNDKGEYAIFLYSKSDELTSSEKDVLQIIIDNTFFIDKSDTGDKAYYKHEVTGTSFPIPDGWHETKGNMGIKLLPDDSDYNSIEYFYEDLCGENEESLRKYIDSSHLSKEKMAELFGISIEEISEVTFGDEVYYSLDIVKASESMGFISRSFIKVHNGYVQGFLFAGEKDSTYYQEFENLMNYVKYPDISNTE